jgi:hypothetical protein
VTVPGPTINLPATGPQPERQPATSGASGGSLWYVPAALPNDLSGIRDRALILVSSSGPSAAASSPASSAPHMAPRRCGRPASTRRGPHWAGEQVGAVGDADGPPGALLVGFDLAIVNTTPSWTSSSHFCGGPGYRR